ncbi:tetratricopeptide repeat protein [Luteibacter yeojuensis]
MLVILTIVTTALYAPGLTGGFLFDDYPNIVDNPAVQPKDASLASLVAAAFSSPSSELKRPLASLTFAANFLATGLDASAMKVTNLLIHLANGVLLFALLRLVLSAVHSSVGRLRLIWLSGAMTLAWLLLPINLTSVLYVVQRMEALANLFVLLGLLGYTRLRMRARSGWRDLAQAIAWVVIPAMVGVLAKETAILLPLYALLLEMFVFRFRWKDGTTARSLAWAFCCILIPPLLAAAAWLGPQILNPLTWATRDFTLTTRLLSEPRILVDYLYWTVFPTGAGLSFYHDDFVQSTGWLTPWTTTVAIGFLSLLAASGWILRRKRPIFALGIAWFFACHTLTGTVLPLELVYEHRNYFASIGVVMAVSDILLWATQVMPTQRRTWRHAMVLAATLLVGWSAYVTASTAAAWSTSLGLARELAERGPNSPRAQYEMGRAYIIASHYDRSSIYTMLAYEPLERAASLPASSILPEQALIFMTSRMNLPVKDAWWTSIVQKLKARPATVQDESSLDSLSTCLRQSLCKFPSDRLSAAFSAALSHERRSPRLLAMYATFASQTLEDNDLAIRIQREAVNAAPNEAAYRITLARYAIRLHDNAELKKQIYRLESMNLGGSLDVELAPLRAARDSMRTSSAPPREPRRSDVSSTPDK